jgi:integrase/recombinase XerD
MKSLADTRNSLPRATSASMADDITKHLNRCRARNFAARTITDREIVLRRIDADLPLGLNEATTEELQEWLVGPQPPDKPWSAKTRETYFDHVVAYYRDPVVAERIGWDPSAGLIRPRVPQGLPKPAKEDEVRRAYADLPRPYDLYVMLAGSAGLRAGEIARLRREDVAEDLITIDEGKGGKSRTVDTHRELWQRIRLVRPGPLALLESGRIMTSKQLASRVAHRLDMIGLPHLSIHCFRHRFATMMLRPKALGGAGADLLTVSVLLGHSNPNTTKIYCLISSEQRRLAIQALPALAPVSR